MRGNLIVDVEIRASGIFDNDYYLSVYPDVATAMMDPVDHYVSYGAAEGRAPNGWFDPVAYTVLVGTAADNDLPPFLHLVSLRPDERAAYAKSIRRATPEMVEVAMMLSNSSEFDADYYLSQLESGKQPIAPALHYVVTGSKLGLRPNRTFDPGFYRRAYPDVVHIGDEPLHHYLQYGRKEGRLASHLEVSSGGPYSVADIEAIRQSRLFDPTFYRKMVKNLGNNIDPLLHYLNIGSFHHVNPSEDFDTIFYTATVLSSRSSGLPSLVHYLRYGKAAGHAIKSTGRYHWISDSQSGDDDVHIERLHDSRFVFRHELNENFSAGDPDYKNAVAELAACPPCDSMSTVDPAVSIIVPVYGQLPVVLRCLDSLSIHESKHKFEVILLDDASPEEAHIGSLAGISWLRYIHAGQNRGFIGACNYAAEHAKGDYLVLLNSDTRVCDGWLDELIDTFTAQPDAGFVGSKLYNDDGSLQEAGAIVWEDGSAWNYGRNDRPERPEYSYARQVDYCSGAAIAVPRELWRELGGFDPHFAPAYYEDVDLAFRVRQAGKQVWMQPLARVIHYEGMTHGRDETKGVKASQVINAKKFFERWSETLRTHGRNGARPLEASNRGYSKQMLAIDWETPAPKRDAGSVMTVKLLQIYQRLGWHVTFLPFSDRRFHPDHSADLQRFGIEVVSNTDPEAFLSSRAGMYEAVLAFRVNVLEGLLDRFRAIDPAMLILFHDIDLHFLRMEREASLTGNRLSARRADLMKTAELELAAKVDCTIVPSTVEKDILGEELGIENVVVYSYTAEAVQSDVGYADRRALVFVGGFRHVPNIDAMQFFLVEVWPSLKDRLPSDAKLYIIGSDAPESIKALADDRVVFTGFLEDLAPTLQLCRVFVAPLRYGAGLKGKVVTSLAHGVPCVASSIAIEGMGLTPDEQVLEANDVDTFVAQIVRVYEDESLWNRLREAGIAFVEEQYGWETGMDVAREILNVAEASWYERQKVARNIRLAKALACGSRKTPLE